MNQIYQNLKERGYIYQATNLTNIKKLLTSSPVTFYLGIDPTADSLHIGHFFALTMVRRLQKAGHKPIIVIGGATALVGDPTAKSNLRKMLTKEEVAYNKQEVKKIIKRFVTCDGPNAALILDNFEWIKSATYIDFMREIGLHFNVNKMLAAECYKLRLASGGLTFLEMGYMLMQAYDFIYLNKHYGCQIQIGGSDQWPNILAGVELGRKMTHAGTAKIEPLYGVTCPLLVKGDGEKMGKTAKGTLWVSREKTTVYDFYQAFINSYDEDVERLLAFFSDYDMKTIKNMCQSDIVVAKKLMAYEVTKLVHGEKAANIAETTAEAVFTKKVIDDNMPTVKLAKEELKKGIDLLDLLVLTKLASSKSAGRRLVEQGGIRINRQKITNPDMVVTGKDTTHNYLLLQKGKKSFKKVEFN